ncbi:MAG: hypothetical protein ACE15D_18935 [Candidatus Eisenbacteria bacterium]
MLNHREQVRDAVKAHRARITEILDGIEARSGANGKNIRHAARLVAMTHEIFVMAFSVGQAFARGEASDEDVTDVRRTLVERMVMFLWREMRYLDLDDMLSAIDEAGPLVDVFDHDVNELSEKIQSKGTPGQ